MKYTKFLLIATLTTFGYGATAEAGEWDTIRFATEGAYKPWNFTDESGELKGFDVDLYTDLCRRLEIKCTIQPHAWKGLIPSLVAENYDAIIAGMSATPRRRETITFSRNYGQTQRSFFVMSGSELNLDIGEDLIDLDEVSPEEQTAIDALKTKLEGKVVGVVVQTTLEKFMTKFMPDIELKVYETDAARDLDLEVGRIDVGMHTVSYIIPAIADGKAFDIIGPGFMGDVFGGGQSIGVRKEDQDLADLLSGAIDEAIADGTMKELSIKWFGFDLSPVN